MKAALRKLWLLARIKLDSIYLRFFVRPRERPGPIDIPTVFANFVEEYGGIVCDRTVEARRTRAPVADFIFREQDVIAELKCLETDPYSSSAGSDRLWTDLKKGGMSEREIADWASGRGQLSDSANWQLATLFRRRIEKITRKAEKQIEATKQTFGMSSAEGLLLIANDNNLLFSYPQKLRLISDVFARHFEDSVIKGFVFFTPNVPMRVPNSLREWHPWTTAYSKTASDHLVSFVDDLGHHWGQLFFAKDGSPHIKSSDRDFAEKWMADARNVNIRRE